MAAFTLCAGIRAAQAGAVEGPQRLRRAAANWDSLDVDQLLIGESDLPPQPQRQVLADVATNANDDPCLRELLRCCAEQTRQDWLLFTSADALLSTEFCANLSAFCSSITNNRKRLLVGRAWRLSDNLLDGLEACQLPPTAEGLTALINAHGYLDPAGQFSWALLPRGVLQAAPVGLGCDPAEVLPWLISSAQTLGWPSLDCTAAAPLAAPLAAAGHTAASHTPTAACKALWPGSEQAPKLSLLLAAPESQLQQLADSLCPTPSLPWEVVARPADPSDGAGAVAAAWASALEVAQGHLAWPITTALPPLALLPAVLRCFDTGGVDLLQLGWQLGSQPMPVREPNHQEPGCLVAQTAWLRRVMTALPHQSSPAAALLWMRQQAERRGACTASLPLTAIQRSDVGAAIAV